MQVECHVIHADMALSADVPHNVPILEHLRERGGGATAASLSEELFLIEPVCRSLLAFCGENGLAEEAGGGRYAITPEGTAALGSGRAFTRREGMWKVYVASHGAIPEGAEVVRIEDGSTEAGYMPWMGDRQPAAKRLGPAARALEGATLRPALGTAREAVVRDIHGNEKEIEADMSLRLRIRLDGGGGAGATLLASRDGGVAGRGRTPGLPGEAALPCAPVTEDMAMESLLDGERGMEWDAKNGRIAADYDCLSDEERSSMRKTMRFEDVEIGGMRFEAALVTAGVFPQNEADARKWARHLFADMAADYVTREEYERLAGSIEKRLEYFDAGMGDRAGHVPKGGGGRGARRRPRLFWLVQAMEDWDL